MRVYEINFENSILITNCTGIELKPAAKTFAQKFATGSSVTKNPQGREEIVVQGDVTDEVEDMLHERKGPLQKLPEKVKVSKEDK